MEERLRDRELAFRSSHRLNDLHYYPVSHRPHAFERSVCTDVGLVRRLREEHVLQGHSGTATAVCWNVKGDFLASAGEDCRVKIWEHGHTLLTTFESGHTNSITGASFLPGCDASTILTCSADHQVRLINLVKGAVRPYAVHAGPVHTVLPLDANCFLSAGEDGTVRLTDIRTKSQAVAAASEGEVQDGHRNQNTVAACSSDVLIDQKKERGVTRTAAPASILTLSIDENRPWMMLTGGTDPFLRLYDCRMVPPSPSHSQPHWVSCYAPTHLRSITPSRQNAGQRYPQLYVSGVDFARGGREVVGSYCGDCAYSFDVEEHGRIWQSLVALSDTVTRIPRHHMAVNQTARRAARRALLATTPAPAPGNAAFSVAGPQIPAAGPVSTLRQQQQSMRIAPRVRRLVQRRSAVALHSGRNETVAGSGGAGLSAIDSDGDGDQEEGNEIDDEEELPSLVQRQQQQQEASSLAMQHWQQQREEASSLAAQVRHRPTDSTLRSPMKLPIPEIAPADHTTTSGMSQGSDPGSGGGSDGEQGSPLRRSSRLAGRHRQQAEGGDGLERRDDDFALHYPIYHAARSPLPPPEPAQTRLESTLGLLRMHRAETFSEVALAEVTSPPANPPAPSVAVEGAQLGTGVGSLLGGHQVSSLNSVEVEEQEQVDSIAQRGPMGEAPSVGNAPHGGGGGGGGSVFARPSFVGGATVDGGQHISRRGQGQQQQQQQRRQAWVMHRPTASTGRSRPPPAGGTTEPQQQQQTQVTSLSGRGPSAVGEFMPSLAVDLSVHNIAGGGHHPGPASLISQDGLSPVPSDVGAIVHAAHAGDGEEVGEPSMYLRRFGGHLNMGGAGCPQRLALLASHEQDLLVSPSDDGSIFIWSIPSGELVAVLQSEAVSHTEDHHALCAVAAHPAMLRLASAGTDGIIRTWSPEDDFDADSLYRAAAVVQRNMAAMAETGPSINPREPPFVLPVGLDIGEAGEIRVPGRDGALQCTIM